MKNDKEDSDDTDESFNDLHMLFGSVCCLAKCHASTVLGTYDGSFLTAWFGGEKECSNDV